MLPFACRLFFIVADTDKDDVASIALQALRIFFFNICEIAPSALSFHFTSSIASVVH